MRHIVTFITGLNRGGAETVLLQILETTRRDFRHTVVSLRAGDKLVPDFRAAGAEVIELGFNHGQGPGRLAAALRKLRGLKPDSIMGQMYLGCIAASLYRLVFARRTPLNWVIHHSLGDWKSEKFSTRASVLMCKYLSRAPRHIVFVSAESAEDHRRIGFRPEGFLLIPNACDTRKFHYDAVAGRRLRASLGIEDGDFVFGHVARVHPLKDHPTMLKALEIAVEKKPEIVVLFCGPGTTELAIPVGLHRHVRLLGERTDIPQVMSACDAGVLSSTSEGGPNVVAEFLACERVCVSTAVGAAADMIADAGLIVPISNPTAMANALVAVAAMPLPELRARGLAAKAAVERRFSLEKTTQEFHSLWTDVNDIDGLS